MTYGVLEAMGDSGRHGGVQRVVVEHCFRRGELVTGRLLGLLLGGGKLLLVGALLGRKLFLGIHDATSSGFLKVERKGLPGAVQFAANSVGRLFGQRRHLVIA